MKKDDIEVGETYLFVGSDSPKRKHLAGQAFTVVSKDQVYRKVSYRHKKRSTKVTRFFNDDGIGARADELEPLPLEMKGEWVEASTPPEKEGFYNVITAANCFLISPYELGDWGYNRETDEGVSVVGMGTPDRVVKYRPGSYQPFKDEREFPCTECETGEMKFYSGGGPNGIETYMCTECGHTATFP